MNNQNSDHSEGMSRHHFLKANTRVLASISLVNMMSRNVETATLKPLGRSGGQNPKREEGGRVEYLRVLSRRNS